ncbi:unnamed protein product [Caretta caretta]
MRYYGPKMEFKGVREERIRHEKKKQCSAEGITKGVSSLEASIAALLRKKLTSHNDLLTLILHWKLVLQSN